MDFNQSTCECFTQDTEEWFYDSIRKYKKLQMYDLEMSPSCLATHGNWMCLGGYHKEKRKTEILCTELPKKLFLPPEESDRCKDNDFEISQGQFFTGELRKMAMLPQFGAVVVSYKRESGLHVLTEVLESREKSISSGLLMPQTYEPNFSVSPSGSHLLVCKTNLDSLALLDCNTHQDTPFALPLCLADEEGEVVCEYVNSNTAILLHSATGTIVKLDLRTERHVVIHKGEVSSSYFLAYHNNSIATLDVNNKFNLFDIRNPEHSMLARTLEIEKPEKTNPEFVKIRMDSSRLSVSGLNNHVDVFKILEYDVQHVFTHKGHCYLEESDGTCLGTVMDHVWVPQIGDNFILSCSNNGSLICWQYKL